jgi:hypothetical protein
MEKNEAFYLFERTREQLIRRAREVAENICYQKGQFTVDDVRHEMNEELKEAVERGIDLRFLGGALGHCKDFKKIGYSQTRVNTSHGRPIAVFRLRLEEE